MLRWQLARVRKLSASQANRRFSIELAVRIAETAGRLVVAFRFMIEVELTQEKRDQQRVPKGANRMPSDSVFYDRLVPIILIALGAITIGLIVVAVGILVGAF